MKKLAQYEAQILAEALQDTLKKQINNYVDNVREIKTILNAETKNYPPKLKSALNKYYSILDEIQAQLLDLKNNSVDLVDKYPGIEVWKIDNLKIDMDAFLEVLMSQGIDTNPKKTGALILWDSDHVSIYTERMPSEKNDNLGSAYLLGDNLAIKNIISKLKRVGEVVGEESGVSLP